MHGEVRDNIYPRTFLSLPMSWESTPTDIGRVLLHWALSSCLLSKFVSLAEIMDPRTSALRSSRRLLRASRP